MTVAGRMPHDEQSDDVIYYYCSVFLPFCQLFIDNISYLLVHSSVMHTALFLISSSTETTYAAQRLARTLAKKGFRVDCVQKGMFRHFIMLLFRTYDVIHIHGTEASSAIWIKKMLFPKTPCIYSLHEREEFHPHRSWLGRIMIHIRRRSAVRYADDVVATKKYLQQFIYERYSRLPLYIPNGIDITHVSPPQKRKNTTQHVALLCESEDTRTVSRLSRIGKKRGSRLRNISVLTPSHSARHIQTVLHSASAVCAVSPIRSRFLLTQAATAPVPIIAIDIELHREHLGGEALYLRNGGTEELRAAFARLRTHATFLRNEAVIRSRKAASLYSWDHVTEEYLHIYNRPDTVYIPLDSCIARLR